MRKLNTNQTISTVPGNGRDLAFDPNGNLIEVSGGYLQRLMPNSTLVTIIGEVAFGFHGDGGPASSCRAQHSNWRCSGRERQYLDRGLR